MQCPSCKKAQPMSFRCRHCGAELIRRPSGTVRRPPPPPPNTMPVAAGAAAGAMAFDNPYQAPRAMGGAPIHMASGEKALASRGARLGAQMLDGIVGLASFIPVIIDGALAPESQTEPGTGSLLITCLALVALAIYQISLLSTEGQTIGKRALKIRIVRYDDGTNPGFGRVVGLRLMLSNFLFGLIPGFGPFVDVLFIFGSERRCLHDYIAGTKVVEA